MKHFAILRTVPNDLTWDQFDGAAIQNMINLQLMGDPGNIQWTAQIPDVTWVRSYWAPGSTWGTCLYTAPDEATVREWHDICRVDYARIREVDVVEAAEPVGDYPRGFHEPGTAAPLIVIETAAEGSVGAPDGLRWIRTYRDAASGEELRLFHAPEPAWATVLGIPVPARRVVEVRPGDYE